MCGDGPPFARWLAFWLHGGDSRPHPFSTRASDAKRQSRSNGSMSCMRSNLCTVRIDRLLRSLLSIRHLYNNGVSPVVCLRVLGGA